jgi:hypothetical protein
MGSVGGAVAVVVVGVVVATAGTEEQGGQAEQAAAGEEHGAEVEARAVHRDGPTLKAGWNWRQSERECGRGKESLHRRNRPGGAALPAVAGDPVILLSVPGQGLDVNVDPDTRPLPLVPLYNNFMLLVLQATQSES